MASQKKTEKATKIKKKRWYSIIAPKMFRSAFLGETYIAEPKLAMGKTITKNLMDLTNDVKKQNINIKFAVDNIEGDKAHTKLIGFNMINSSIKRLTRRRSNKIELSFVCQTSDNIKVRVKPLMFTRSITKSSVNSTLNKAVTEQLTRAISKMSFESLVNDLINHRIQSHFWKSLKKVYPLRNFEIKSMAIEKEKKPMEGQTAKAVKEKADSKPETKAEEKKEEIKKETKQPKKEAEEISETQNVSDDAQKASLSDKPKEEKKPETAEKKEEKVKEEKKAEEKKEVKEEKPKESKEK